MRSYSIAIVIFVSSIMLGSCQRVYQYDFVVPEGYIGLLQIIEDQSCDQKKTIEFNSEGIVYVPSIDRYKYGWNLPIPQYSTGQLIELAAWREDSVKGVAVWIIPQQNDRIEKLFIGSIEDVENYFKSLPGIFDIPD